MTLKQNITSILECHFSGFKDELIEACAKRIMEQIERQANTPQTDKDKVVCPNCGRSDYIRSFEKDFGIKNSEYKYKCINCNTYIKDTPQTDCGWK